MPLRREVVPVQLRTMTDPQRRSVERRGPDQEERRLREPPAQNAEAKHVHHALPASRAELHAEVDQSADPQVRFPSDR